MATEWFSCKGACSGSNPVSDTVKVDFSKLASEKENVQPLQIQNKAEGAQKEQDEKRRAQEELVRHQQKIAEQRRQEEEQARRRREAEEVERRREQQAAAERAAAERAAAEAAAREAAEREAAEAAERAAAEEKARQEREAAESAALWEAQKHEEERLAREKVNSWCKTNGFVDMNSKKKSSVVPDWVFGAKFPLHEAVAKNNEEIVGLMVLLGADKGLKNSKGQTALDLAQKMNKGGSMDGILDKLR